MLRGTLARSLWIAAFLVLSAGGVWADWPQFLGPHRNGVEENGRLLAAEWWSNIPRVLWTVPVGPGFGGAAIYKSNVLILDRKAGEQDILRCLHVVDGNDLWQYAYDAPGDVQYPGSRSTPATDGETVYSVGSRGHLKAVTLTDGELVWQGNVLADWGAAMPEWGVAQSPLLLEDSVVVAPWGIDAAVAAYGKASGEILWATPNSTEGQMAYQSVVPMTLDGRLTLVASAARGYTIGVDAATGEQLWEFDSFECSTHIPSPTIVDGGRILLTGGYGAGTVMFRVFRQGNSYATETLWANSNMGSQSGQALIHGDHIYGNSYSTGGGIRCLSLDGEIVWDSTKEGRRFDLGNLLIVGDVLFAINGRDGALFMLAASPRGYEGLGLVQVLSGNEVWGPLAYSDGHLIIRDQQNLVCLDVRAE